MQSLVASLTCPHEKTPDLLHVVFKDCSPVWHMAEHIERITLGVGLPVWEEPWRTGSIFCEQWDVRWRRRGNETLVTILTEGSVLPSLPAEIPPKHIDRDWYTGGEMHVQLWGHYYIYPHVSGFMEVRIPHFLDYPASSSGKWQKGDEATMIAVPYKKNGAVQFLRLKEIKRGD
jgi:hypothetical protein